ncbi:hypothetical protein [Halorussus salinisoli]|uniref:hypothetical protein n=1 Tax=Halorussus salinisoli TaxID=2558242 RepID=UPI0010C19603|nr:hypothetical protein [Halorussus salinisoli]
MPDQSDKSRPTDSDIERHIRGAPPRTAPNRQHDRRPPDEHSEAGLLSRDYQPRHGGPELIASWPLGPAPSQTEPGDVDWKVASQEPVQLQRNLTVNHFLGPIENAKIYAGVRGIARVENGETLTLSLETTHLKGEEYETEIELTNVTTEPFLTPLVEFVPDANDYREHSFIGREMYGGYVLSAAVSGGTGYVDQGTAVHLWSE